MNEYAVVSPHTVYEQVGQKVFPKLSDGFVASSFEHHVLLHAVGHDAIERTEQAVEETRNPKVMLCKLQCRFAERCSPQMLVCLTVVGEQCRQLGGRLEVLKTQPVLSREFVAAFQLLRQFFYGQSSHLRSQFVGCSLKPWSGARQKRGVIEHDFGVG